MSYFVIDTATEAFDEVFGHLYSQYKEGYSQPSRVGDVVGEILNAQIVLLDPTRGIVDSKIRKMPIRYAVGELAWYLSGSNKAADIGQYSKFWNDISDDGETLNSAYGYRIYEKFGFDQWEHAKYLLKADPFSRQAVIHIKDASNVPTKDTPCTLSLQFQIRGGHLHLTTNMRSNDIWLGFPFDVFAFTFLQIKMAMELGVKVGTYTHNAASLHLYRKDAEQYEVKMADKSTF